MEAVRHGGGDPARPGRLQGPRRRGQGPAAGADVVHKRHVRAPETRIVRVLKADLPVPLAGLSGDQQAGPQPRRRRPGPGRALGVRPGDQVHAGPQSCEGRGQHLPGAGVQRPASRKHRRQVRRAVQVRLQGQHPVEGRGQDLSEDRLAQGLAVVEDPVLPHVGEVGGDEVDARRPRPPQGVRRQQQGHQPHVRPGEAAVEEGLAGHRDGRDGAGLSVREAVRPDQAQGQAEGLGEASRRPGLVGKGVHGRAHARTNPLSSPAASQARAKSAGSSACRR
uniref:Uncharacterized protein n=1 Tax=uncultured bacterium CBNPD1 BAC clone 1664 TaxID=417310 RepID=B1N6N7_9BACT|nr:hypothetical protein [uncultured bacterium CBNPD1 BAC clone 1664]